MWKQSLAIGLGIIFLILVALGRHHVKLPPHTYREAVMQVLATQHVLYDDVTVGSFCPHSPGCRGSTVGMIYAPWIAAVEVAGPRPAQGQMVCIKPMIQGESEHCTLSLIAFELRDLPLPALVQGPTWMTRFQHSWQMIKRWVRKLVSTTLIPDSAG